MIYDRRKVIQHYRREHLATVYRGIDELGFCVILVTIGIVIVLALDCMRWQLALQGMCGMIGTMLLVWLGVWYLDHTVDHKIEKQLRHLETTNKPTTDVQHRLLQITKLYQIT